VKQGDKKWERRRLERSCTLQHRILDATDNTKYELTAELRGIKRDDVKQAKLVAILRGGNRKDILASLPREMTLNGKTTEDGADATCISWEASEKEWRMGRFDLEVTTTDGHQFVVIGRRPNGFNDYVQAADDTYILFSMLRFLAKLPL